VTIEVLVGDITQVDAEAIVNAANSQLWMGGGVAGAIKRAGGSEIETEAMAQGPIQPGESVITTAGSLPAPIKWVVHAATMGPDLQTSEDYIRAATRSALAAAVRVGAKSIAMPAFGTGVGGFPIDLAADVMAEEAIAAAEAGHAPERVLFVVRNDSAAEAFRKGLAAA
jgi:O-acetyl-ADP-ribose deacetylase (regulator of RNase III)